MGEPGSETLPGPSFGGFGAYGNDDQGPRRWFAASAASLGVYALIIVAVVVIGRTARDIIAPPKEVEIKFVEKVVKPPPPPPPPAPIAQPKPVVPPKPAAPAAAAPVVQPHQKVIELDKAPPPKKLAAPQAMPKAPPKEADPSLDKGVAVYGEGKGDPAGLEGGVAGKGVVGGMVGGAIALPEDASPPKPSAANPKPSYPESARVAGKTSEVILKVVILADGTVADVQVMRGEEPFKSAAVATVRKWRYEPARHKGQAITVYRIVRVPFKLRA